MILLLDTHLLLRAASEPERLSKEAVSLIEDDANDLLFSAASIWEVAIKASLRGADFGFDPFVLRRGLLDNGYGELAITSAHGAEAGGLPPIHKDPFDRMLVAQARIEGFVLLTADRKVAQYGAPARLT